jgi:hypothetical protein
VRIRFASCTELTKAIEMSIIIFWFQEVYPDWVLGGIEVINE